MSLTVSNAAGSNSVSKVVTIADNRPDVRFCYQRQGTTVSFSDGSTHSPTAWTWTFGDCSASPATCQSNLRNPSHTYAANGTYTVNLAVSNASGSASRSASLQIDGSNDTSQICVP